MRQVNYDPKFTPVQNYVLHHKEPSRATREAHLRLFYVSRGEKRKRLLDTVTKDHFHFLERMIGFRAKKYGIAPFSAAYLDLESVALEELLAALGDFDIKRGIRFTTYFEQRCETRFNQHYWSSYAYRIPENVKKDIRTLKEAQTCKEDYPSLAKATGFDVSKIALLIACNKRAVSLDAPVAEDSDVLLRDTIPGQSFDEAYEKHEDDYAASTAAETLNLRLAEALKSQDTRSKFVIRAYYGFESYPQSLTEIGKQLGVSKQRVSVIRNKTLKQLRNDPNLRELHTQTAGNFSV